MRGTDCKIVSLMFLYGQGSGILVKGIVGNGDSTEESLHTTISGQQINWGELSNMQIDVKLNIWVLQEGGKVLKSL